MTTTERSIEEIVEEFKSLRVTLYDYSRGIEIEQWLTQTLKTERQKREEQSKRYITLMNQSLGGTELPEEVWKKIAKVNQLILDK